MVEIKRVPAFGKHEDDQPQMLDGVALFRAPMVLIQSDVDLDTLFHRDVEQRDIRRSSIDEVPHMNHLVVMLARDRVYRSGQGRGEILVDLCFQDAICRS